MNKLRFKFWDNIDYMSSPCTILQLQHGKIQACSDITVLQNSGFQDSTGNDIYEGDIVYVAGFSHRAKVIITPDHGVEFEDAIGYHRSALNATVERDIGKILGNIYQNPEMFY